MKKIIFGITLLLSVFANAQTQSIKDGIKPPIQKDDNAQTPPAVIVRSIVKRIVDESKAQIIQPEDVDEIKTKVSDTRKSFVSEYPHNYIPKPVTRPFYLEPDSTDAPRLVRLSSGSITSLVFTDNFGNPWLIKARSFDPNIFTDGSDSDGGKTVAPTNILKLSPKIPYAYGNIVVELEGLGNPIIFMMAAGQSDETDIRIDARVVGKNPGAKPQAMVMDKMPDNDLNMSYFLDGIPPASALKMKTFGGKAEVWSLNGFFYVRTRMTLLSPRFLNHSGSADGEHVYKFEQVPSIFGSIDGRTTTLTISGY